MATASLAVGLDAVPNEIVRFDRVAVKRGEVCVLRDLNLRVSSGEFICVLGASGSGKTTLLRVFAGLQRVSSGYIYRGGHPNQADRLRVALVPQEPTLLPWKTVLWNIACMTPRTKVGSAKECREQAALSALNKVGLTAAVSRQYPKELSGGMLQRAALARALASAPDLILMDEPLSALDERLRFQLTALILNLSRADRPTILMNTHSILEACILATRIVVLLTTKEGSVSKEYSLNEATRGIPMSRDVGTLSADRQSIYHEVSRLIHAET